jgi:serine protease AprX
MTKQVYRFVVVLSILSLLFLGAATPAPANYIPWRDKVDPWVLEIVTQGEAEFMVYLTTQADLSAARALPTKLEKGTYVYQTLLETAQRTQVGLVAELDELGVEYRSFYITNVIWVKAGPTILQALAARSDVAHIYANPHVKLEAPVVDTSPQAAPEGVEPNIIKVNAPDVWALGDTGQGVVIGGQDTGYDWDHPAIINQYRGWDGSVADHNYNWHDAIHGGAWNPCGFDLAAPCDDYGHGTHTMGTMVGDDGGSNQIGMAPGARWIGCRNMDYGVGTPATYAECYEWFIAPYPIGGTPADGDPAMAPDVINNSWSCPPSEGCTDPTILHNVVQNLVAAGIVSATSAGNAGSSCSSIVDPPAIYEESFTVGATDNYDNIASFSSRGPVLLDGSPHQGPDVSAPGVGVRSCYPGGGYTSMSGTSMAGPHVAGEVALLISAQPSLRGQVDQIESTIEQTAFGRGAPQTCGGDHLGDIPNNVYGWGRIDALAAVQALHYFELEKVASAPFIMPGDLITYTLTLTHESEISPTTNVVLTDTIPLNTSFVSATAPYTQTGDVIQWDFPTLDAHQATSVNLTVQVDITATGSITNDNYIVRSDQVAPVYGKPVITTLEEPNLLELAKQASAPLAYPGDLITYTLSLTNTQAFFPITHITLTDVLPVGTTFVSASQPYTLIGDEIGWYFLGLDPLETRQVELVVRVDRLATGSVINTDYGVYSDQTPWLQGSPVTTLLGRLFFLPILDKNP